MQPNDNHDHSLMIYANWLDDQGRWQEAEWIREDLQSPQELSWEWEYQSYGVGVGGSGGGGVGGGGDS